MAFILSLYFHDTDSAAAPPILHFGNFHTVNKIHWSKNLTAQRLCIVSHYNYCIIILGILLLIRAWCFHCVCASCINFRLVTWIAQCYLLGYNFFCRSPQQSSSSLRSFLIFSSVRRLWLLHYKVINNPKTYLDMAKCLCAVCWH